MKIAVIGTRGFPGVQGGVEKHCEELYPRLAALGFDVTVFARAPYFPPERRVPTWRGVTFRYLPAPRSKHFEAISHSFLAALRCVAQRGRFDAVHVHNIGPALCMPLLKPFGLRTVLTYHSPNYEHQKWGRVARAILRLGEWVGVRSSSRIITISEINRKLLEEKYGRPGIAFIPNGISRAERVGPGETLQRHQLQPGRYVFTACRFVEGKGLEDLIAAFRCGGSADVRLVIAGDADHETRYSRMIKALAAETPGVVLTGFITGRPLQELYSNAGLFVLPSYSEGLPLAVLEAMSYDVPVLASDIPANRQIALPEFRYYPAGNVDALAARMGELMRHGLSAAERDAHHRLLAEQFDWDRAAQQTAAVFNQLA